MKAISARATAGLNLGAIVISADNSGAKIVKIVSVKKSKAKKKKQVERVWYRFWGSMDRKFVKLNVQE